MKVFKEIGSKERFAEIFQNVNKVRLNEAFGQGLNPQTVLAEAFNELKAGALEIKHTSTQAENNESYVELLCVDKQGNNVSFVFKAIIEEGDQQGVFNVTEVALESFSFDSAADEESVDLSGDALKQFNIQHQNEMLDVVDKYMDVEEEEEIDTLYEDAVKLIDKVPYKAGSEKMVTHAQYADEKPTNPEVRVTNADELKKFVKEQMDTHSIISNTVKKYFNSLSPESKQQALELAKHVVDSQLGGFKERISQDMYDKAVLNTAYSIYATELAGQNEGIINENDYPKELGKEFKPESQSDYAKKTKAEKKHKTKKVKIKEAYQVVDSEFNRQFFGDSIGGLFDKPIPYAQMRKLTESFEVDDEEIEDLTAIDDIPLDARAEKAAMKDIKAELPKGDVIDPYSEITLSEEEPVEQVPTSMEGMPEEEPETDDGMSLEPSGDEVEQISQEKEKVGDLLQGGMADGKLPAEYDPEQIKMGIDVEKEHTDNPMVSVEIATDHLEEIPDYYTRLDKMEKDAKAEQGGEGEEEKPSEEQDKELTDELLGYKPMNVGETFDYAAAEVGYENKDAYQRYLDYQQKDFNELTDDQKEEFFELWKEFKGAEKSAATPEVPETPEAVEEEIDIVKDAEKAPEDDKENELKQRDPATWHQIQIAKKTLKMPDAMVGVMGGPSKEEAKEILRKHNIKQLQEMAAGKKTKMFKIGEYAVGGIIQVDVVGKVVLIKALDWNTKKPVSTGSTSLDDPNAMMKIEDYLNELTSYYYAEKIMEWIKGSIGDKSNPWDRF